MKRYYLSQIFYDESGSIPAWRHKLQTIPDIDYQGGEIAVDSETGIPTQKQLLVLVGGIDHKQLQNVEGLVPVPDVAIDVKVSAIHTKTKLDFKKRIKDELDHTDADVNAVIDNADGIRDVLNHYGKLNNPEFDVNNFDLDES